MPCTDNYPQNSEWTSAQTLSTEKENRKLLRENENLTKENVLREAQLCALLTELYKNNLDIVVTAAERDGKVDIQSFWESHQKKDESKIDKILGTLSKHERDLLKKKLG